MRSPRFYLSWPGSHLREIGVAVALGLIALLANLFWQPSVRPLMPAELAAPSPAKAVPSGMVVEESLDFIFRPLFLPARRPLESVVAQEVVEEPVQQTLSLNLLDGYQLLGVFSSGERGGAILLNKDKQRVRVFTGDSVEGWVLDRTDLRAAHFRDAVGGSVSLDLAVASTLPMPTVVAPRGEEETEAGVNNAGDTDGANAAPPAYDGPVTFESIANRQKQEAEAKIKASNP